MFRGALCRVAEQPGSGPIAVSAELSRQRVRDALDLISEEHQKTMQGEAAVVTAAMLRTCEVRLPAMKLTLSVRSFHVPATPDTSA